MILLSSATFPATLNSGLGLLAMFMTVIAGLAITMFIFTCPGYRKYKNLQRFAKLHPDVSGLMLLQMTGFATGIDVIQAEEMLQAESPPFGMTKGH
jgi:hypothetical protein